MSCPSAAFVDSPSLSRTVKPKELSVTIEIRDASLEAEFESNSKRPAPAASRKCFSGCWTRRKTGSLAFREPGEDQLDAYLTKLKAQPECEGVTFSRRKP